MPSPTPFNGPRRTRGAPSATRNAGRGGPTGSSREGSSREGSAREGSRRGTGSPRGVAARAATLALLGLSVLPAQQASTGLGGGQAPADRFPRPQSITFDRIHAAEREQWFDVDLARELVERDLQHPSGRRRVRTVEHLRMAPAPNPGGLPRFRLSFVRVEGDRITPALQDIYRVSHERNASFVFRHGTLLVQDPVAAERNYTIFYLTACFRAGRHAHRIAVLPLTGDRSTWIWELDRETGFPLYQAEYLPSGELISSITASRFRHGPAIAQLGDPPGGWNDADPNVREYVDLAGFERDHPSLSALPTHSYEVPPGFERVRLHAVDDDLDPSLHLVSTYGDGLDLIMIRQTFGSRPSGLMRILSGGTQAAALGESSSRVAVTRFQDLHTIQLGFEVGTARFLVVGRAALGKPIQDWTKDLVLRATR